MAMKICRPLNVCDARSAILRWLGNNDNSEMRRGLTSLCIGRAFPKVARHREPSFGIKPGNRFLNFGRVAAVASLDYYSPAQAPPTVTVEELAREHHATTKQMPFMLLNAPSLAPDAAPSISGSEPNSFATVASNPLAMLPADMPRHDVGSEEFLFDITASIVIVMFAGLMSGLTLGLMSLSVLDLEVLQISGNPQQKLNATKVLEVVSDEHLVLVTLLMCNALAMEALPLFLDELMDPATAVLVSVTLVLLFGEVIPQAVCQRFGLAVGANLAPLVKALMFVCYPLARPLASALDRLLGKSGHSQVLGRSQLKALVNLHAKDAGHGGSLTLDETAIIEGALNMMESNVMAAMTPIDRVFSLRSDAVLDGPTMETLLMRGHSRVPVCASHDPTEFLGLIMVKNLILLSPEDATPVDMLPMRPLMRVPADTKLSSMLEQFRSQRGHMALVMGPSPPSEGGMGLGGQGVREALESDSSQWGRVLGIITLEDVLEEMLQLEIEDETDRDNTHDNADAVRQQVEVARVAHLLSIGKVLSCRISSGKGLISKDGSGNFSYLSGVDPSSIEEKDITRKNGNSTLQNGAVVNGSIMPTKIGGSGYMHGSSVTFANVGSSSSSSVNGSSSGGHANGHAGSSQVGPNGVATVGAGAGSPQRGGTVSGTGGKGGQ